MSKSFVLFAFLVFLLAEIVAQPVASFNVNYTVACVPATIMCTNTSTNCSGSVSYNWSITGDPQSSTLQNPVFNFSNVGNYTIVLQLTCAEGSDTYSVDITVESVTASFTTSPTNLFSCSTPFSVNFTNTSSPNATEFFYVFQDGGSSTSENPSHTYNEPGIYQPTLTVVSDAGCMHTFMGPIITIENPSATFVGDVLEGCSPLAVDFDYTGGSAVSNYNWNFGNGQTEPNGTANESSIFTSGDYIVTLTVTNNNGCTASQSVEVNVGDFITFPTNVFDNDSDHTPLPDHFLCAQDTISFYIPNWDDEDYEFSWWIDSTINLANNQEFVDYAFDHDTGFVYLHLLTNNNGCVDTTLKEVFYISGPIIHDISSMSDCLSPRDYQFELNATLADYWDWEIFYYPNPATQTLIESNLNSIDEIFPFTFPPTPDSFWVKVTAYSDTIGCVFVDSVQINVSLPTADFSITNFDVCANVEIEFNGSGSQNATEYYWDFGDGTTSGWVNNSIVNHAFNTAGTFDVLLIVRNSNGCLDSVIHQIHIIGPEIHVDFSDTFVYVDETITFVDNSVADEPIISTHWVFGDGDSSSGSSVSHEYSQPGTYSVTIYVMTDSGCVGEETYPDAITVVAEPLINFIVFPASGPTNADGYVEINIVGGVPPFDVNCSSAKSEYDIDNLAPGNYVLSVEDANGHTASVQFEMTWTTGIIPIEFADSFYPNPASEFIIIQSTNNSLTSLEILDLNGKILLRKDFLSDNEVVDVTSLENGIYFVRTYHQGYSRITKLLICR